VLAQAAVGDRADAARSAGDEAADGGCALGGGVHPQLKPLGLRLGVDRVHLGARTDTQATGLDPFDIGQSRDVEQHAALQRHRLAVIAGAPCPHRDRHAMPCTGRRGTDDIFFVAWRDDEIGRFTVELLVQDRTVPEEIARAPAHDLGFGDEGDIAEIGDQPVRRVEEEITHVRSPARASAPAITSDLTTKPKHCRTL
jgi:hypothetical protein